MVDDKTTGCGTVRWGWAACLLLAGGLLPMLAACQQPRPRENPEAVQELLAEAPAHDPRFEEISDDELETLMPVPEPYRIGRGDVLHIQAPGDDFAGFGETSQGTVVGTKVKEDGNVYMPLLGAVPAADRTVLEVQKDLMERMTKFNRKPFISVDVLEYHSQKYYVLGAVPQPGVFAVDGERTVLEAVSLAGGIDPKAPLDEAVVLRAGKVLPVSLVDMLRKGDLTRNVRMRDGDLVFVPHAAQRKVYVVGEVKNPGVVPWGNGHITLAEALAAAGGIEPIHGDVNQIRIFRGGWAQPRSWTVSTQDVYKYGEDIQLHSGDRIFVAPYHEASFKRMMELTFPLVQQPATAALSAVALGVAASK